MFIKEIFSSIQGESSHIGYPCFFIRTSGCNLRCKWCDTVYAYEGGEEYSIELLESQVKKSPYPLVSLTGGEPLIQNDAVKFLSRIAEIKNKTVILETNGSQSIKDIDERIVKVIDVKCPSSGEEKSFFYENLDYIGENDEVKFVIADRRDYDWSCGFIRKNGIESPSILFSPMADSLKPSSLAKWILDDNMNVRFQIQLHKIIWPGRERGF